MASSVSAQNLGRAPHRVMFFVGVANVLLAMLWWTCWLVAERWALFPMPWPDPYAGHLHAFLMQYQVLPSFFFGFLLTVFPRWKGEPDVDRRTGLPVGLGLVSGQILTLTGALGWAPGVALGGILTLLGWLYGLYILGGVAWRDAGRTWHVVGCFIGMLAGGVGLAFWVAYTLGAADHYVAISIKIGTFGLLTMVFFTVAHRMFPFFAASALPGYVAWRPKWLLVTGWALLLIHMLLPAEWVWAPDFLFFLLTMLMLVRWFPTQSMPPILLVLFVGFIWLPAAFALYTVQSLALFLDGAHILGRAPAHALFVGFFGSILVAMVTRVTQGHSGRPITLPAVGTYAFVAIQLVAVVRIVAELMDDWYAWQAVAAIGWLVTFVPWVIWAGIIYLTPRVDGKPG